MDSGALLVSGETFRPLATAAIYICVSLIAFRWLLPHLSPSARRVASGFLMAHLFVFALALFDLPPTQFDKWLWDVGKEWNIPSAIAASQIALAGGIAIATGWITRDAPFWQRLYFVGLGCVFLFLALDEYFAIYKWSIHSPWNTRDWKQTYFALGALIVAATLLVSMRLPRRLWKWQISLLAGLALVALAGMVADEPPRICGAETMTPLPECLGFLLIEDAIEDFGMWIALVALLGHFSDASPQPTRRARRLLHFAPILSICLFFLYAVAYRPEMDLSRSVITRLWPLLATEIDLRQDGSRVAIAFESNVTLGAYRIQRDADSLGVKLYVSSRFWRDYTGLGYSIHLVDQASGESAASVDASASRRETWRLSLADNRRNFSQRIGLVFAESVAANRAYWIVLTVWRETDDTYARLRVLAGDAALLSDDQVILGELALPAAVDSADAAAAPLANFENGFALEAFQLPDQASPGAILPIQAHWRATADGQEDFAQFLHLGPDARGQWFVYDQPPLGERLPTRLWYAGMRDSETWQVPLPADLAPGQYGVFTGLYRVSDKERLPATDAAGETIKDARVPLGAITIER